MTDHIINIIMPAVKSLGVLGYWIAFFAAMIETTLIAGLILPGSTIILLLGAMAAYGYLDLGDLLWFAIAGAVIGDNINYFLGKKYGSQWARKGIWFLKQEHFEKARTFFDNHGAKSVFLGRFIPSLKEVMPFIAGMVRMRRRTFLLWNILGAIGWGFEWVFTGYLFAQSLSMARMWLSRIGFIMAALFLLFLSLYLIKLAFLKYGHQIFNFAASVGHSVKHAVITNPDVQELVRKHPSLFQFLGQRFSQESFTGLPLTLLSVAFFYVLILFGGVVDDYLTGDPIIAADIRIANLIPLFRSPELIKFFFWITLLGKWQVLLGFMGAVIGTLWILEKRWYIIPLFLSFAGSEVFTTLGKTIFHRPRPDLQVYAEHSFSFPSGHATLAVSFYGFITYLLISSVSGWRAKVNLFFGGVIVIFLIGVSRLYLGVHYLSDVWSGYLVGALWLLIGISLSKYLQPRGPSLKTVFPGRSRTMPLVLIFLALSFYAGFAYHYSPELPTPHFAQGEPRVGNPQDIFADEVTKYTETLLGRRQNPINIIITAESDRKFIKTFRDAGWLPADAISVQSLARIYRAVLLDTSYPTAPVTPSFWNARVNSFAFEKPTDSNVVRMRHHVRFWKTGYATESGHAVYVGSASFDTGIKWGITHRISPDIDTERDYLYSDLLRTKAIESYEKIQLVQPGAGHNFSRDPFYTDGEAYVVKIKSDF